MPLLLCKMERIGIFGGAFDPPHITHLILAERARDEFKLDKILFIPTNIPPHKTPPDASPEDRLELTKRAIEGNSYFEVSDIEIKRGGVSYAVDTLMEIKKIYPKSQLFLLIGMDEALDFINWKEPNEILKLARFIIFTRPKVGAYCNTPLLEKAEFINLNIEISSTNIREFIRKGKSIKYLVPEKVATYIKEKKLYRLEENGT